MRPLSRRPERPGPSASTSPPPPRPQSTRRPGPEPVSPSSVDVVETEAAAPARPNEARSAPGNVFGECEPVDPSSLPGARDFAGLDALGLMQGRHPDAGRTRIVSGTLGHACAARFINARQRQPQGTDYHTAYDDDAFDHWLRAEALLSSIPQGKLAQALTVDLVEEVNRVAFDAPDRGWMRVKWLLANVRRNLAAHRNPFRGARGGRLRPDHPFSQPLPLTAHDIENLKKNGLTVKLLGRPPQGDAPCQASFRPVPPERIPAMLAELVAETRARLQDPSTDIIDVAAEFEQRLDSMHPFEENNGRTALLLMDRILMERGVLPPILKNLWHDMNLSREEFRREVAAGSARMARALGVKVGPGGRGVDAPRLEELGTDCAYGWAKAELRHAGCSPDFGVPTAALRIDGMPFATAPDGFAYNMFGRPYLLNDRGELQPLSRKDFEALVKQIASGPDPLRALEARTRSTRQALSALAAGHAEAAPRVLPDGEAVRADAARSPGT